MGYAWSNSVHTFSLALALLFSWPAQAVEVGWLAFGDLRGHHEPCGCDPKTDLGGLRRLAATLRRESSLQPGLLKFCLGNSFVHQASLSTQEKLKNQLIHTSLAEMSLHAVLVNQTEWQMWKAAQQIPGAGKIPYVLSNTAKAPAGVAAKITKKLPAQHIEIYGFLSKNAEPDLQSADTFIEALKKNKRTTESPWRVLLFSGSDTDLAALLANDFFSVIISSNRSSWSTEAGDQEFKNPASLLIKTSSTDIWQVPLGGEGILRGGKALAQVAPKLDDLFKNQKTSAAPNLSFSSAVPITWLPQSVGGENELRASFAAYNKALKSLTAENIKARQPFLKDSPYAGVEKCSSCHTQAVNLWHGSHHARAFPTLTAKGKDSDPECLSCHVVGLEEKGGFVSHKDSPWLEGVQCEACHGPRKAHSQNPTIKGPPAVKCETCHSASHSPDFNQETYWSKIKHGK